MNRIEIRGAIVPSYYDDDYFQEYIEKGIIIPESVFRRNLAKAKKEPLEIYINSQGGSVFSAYEMVNSTKEWVRTNNQPVTITIGAMAASAASAYALMMNAPIKAYKNSKFMFHGATSMTWSGAGGHEDSADLLNKINADIQSILVSRFKLSPEAVAEWFSEGRMGWLTADEAKESGIVSGIVDDDDETIKFTANDISNISEGGISIAALFDINENNKKENQMEIKKKKGVKDEAGNAAIQTADAGIQSKSDNENETADSDATNEDAGSDEAGADENSSEENAETENEDGGEAEENDSEESNEENSEESDSGEENSEDDAPKTVEDYAGKLVALAEKHVVELKDRDEKIATLNTELNKKQSEMDKAKNSVVELTGKLERLVGNGLSLVVDSATDWKSALVQNDGDYAKARRQYPELYQRFMDANKK